MLYTFPCVTLHFPDFPYMPLQDGKKTLDKALLPEPLVNEHLPRALQLY